MWKSILTHIVYIYCQPVQHLSGYKGPPLPAQGSHNMIKVLSEVRKTRKILILSLTLNIWPCYSFVVIFKINVVSLCAAMYFFFIIKFNGIIHSNIVSALLGAVPSSSSG